MNGTNALSATPPPPEPAAPSWRVRETLIVVAIVAISFVVGLRVYREQRGVADAQAFQDTMKMFSLAVNTYQLEEGAFPSADRREEASGLSGRLPVALTTPTAYINRLLTDPYAPDGEDAVMFYLRREDAATSESAESGGDPVFDAFVRNHIGDPVIDVDYVFWGRGPDGDLDTRETDPGVWVTMRYDPTNGSKSNGDQVFWGPTIGIRRNPYAGTSAAGRGGLQ